MQKRPKEIAIVHYEPALPAGFPAECTNLLMTGEEVSYLHFHRMFEIGYCHYGTGTFYMDKQVHTFYKGDVSLAWPYQAHIAKSTFGTTSYWNFIYIDAPALLEKVGECDTAFWNQLERRSSSVPDLFRAARHPEIHRLVGMMVREFEMGAPSHSYIKALVWAFMAQLWDIAQLEKSEKLEPQPSRDWYQILVPAINFMSNHYAEDIEVDQLAAMCYCSVTHFRRIFKSVMGCTPMRYLAEIRIKVADTLLRTTKMTVCDIGLSVGYHNVSSFNRKYLQIRGMSPSDFRGCNQ